MPAAYKDLAGHQQGALFITVIDDLQQIATLFGGKRFSMITIDRNAHYA
jgi:hypothetical protein